MMGAFGILGSIVFACVSQSVGMQGWQEQPMHCEPLPHRPLAPPNIRSPTTSNYSRGTEVVEYGMVRTAHGKQLWATRE